MNNDIGIIYIATGEKFLKMAAMSAKSLKAHCPNLPTHIFSDCDATSYDCFNSSTKISDPHQRSKVDHIFKTPYQRTLYLDADTRVCEDITSVFELLDRYDIALAHDAGRGRKRQKELYVGNSRFLPVNGGVILFKKTDPVVEFLKSWKKAYHEEGRKGDQFSLRGLLWLSDLRLLILPPEYNWKSLRYLNYLKSYGITPKILHLDDFKHEEGIFATDSLSMRKKIKHIIKYKIMPVIRRRFLGSSY